MKAIKLSQDVVPIGEFKSQAASWLERVKHSEHPIVITQNGKPAAVLLSPVEFDRIQYREYVLSEIEQGEADIAAGKLIDTAEVKRRIKAAREARKSAKKK